MQSYAMFDVEQPPVLQDPAASAAGGEEPDPSVLRAERRLRVLEELTEIGMDLARALRPAAAGGAAEDGPSGTAGRGKSRDPADAFGPLSRAIRLTLGLEARTDGELRDLKAGVTRARAEAAKAARKADAKAREARAGLVRDLVVEAAEAEIDDPDELDEACYALDDRLDLDEAAFAAPGRPLREPVERLCAWLALSPDWSRWTGEGWEADYTPCRSRPSTPDPQAPASPAKSARPGRERPPRKPGHDLQ